MTMVQRPPAGTIPDAPGSYQFKDADGRVIYVGKAQVPAPAALELLPGPAQPATRAPRRWWPRPRRSSGSRSATRSRRSCSSTASSSSTGPASTSGCATTRATRSSPSPSTRSGPGPMVMRGRKRKGVRYFGPYAHAYAIRETLDLLLRTFPIRTCSRQQVRPAPAARPAVPAVPHREVLAARASARSTSEALRRSSSSELLDFLDGDTDAIVKRLETRDARGGRRARVRAGGPAARPARQRCARPSRRQQMVAERNEDLDVIGIADDELEAAVQVFFVRQGRVVGRKGFIVDKVEDLTPGELVGTDPRGALRRRAAARACPSRCSCPSSPTTSTSTRSGSPSMRGLDGRRSGCRSGATSASCWRRSPATRRRSSPATGCGGRPTTTAGPGRSTSCRTHLGLPEAPLRIECYDMSHIQGTDYVGLDGGDGGRAAEEVRLPPVQDRRASPGNDDFAAMEEVLTRRLTAYLAERDKPVERAAGQVRLPAAAAARRRRQGPARRRRAGARGARPRRRDPGRVAGQAVRGGLRARARPTRSASPGSPRRCTCCSGSATRPTASPSRYHRELRGKRMTTSVLDDIPGLGPTRRKRLVKELGGVNARRSASLETLAGAVRGCPTRSPTRSTRRSTAPADRDASTATERPTEPTDLWETHAGWWQDGFTDGADPEYEEQILPLAAEQLAGAAPRARRRLRRGPGRPAGASTGGATLRRRRRPDRGPRSSWRRERGGGPALRPRRRPTRCRSPTARFDAVVACLVFEHIDDVDDAHRRGRPRARARRPVLLLPQPPAAADAEQRLDRRPGPRPARAVLAHRRRTSSRTRRSRRSRRTSSSRSSTGRSAAT